MRRFLVLTPVALGVSAAVFLIVYVLLVLDDPAERSGIGFALLAIVLVSLVAAAVVLALVLVAVGVLRLFGVRNAWAALGLAFGLAVVVLGIIYAGIAASTQPGDPGFNMLILIEAAAVQVPAWLTFAVGLLVGDQRARRARRVGATA